MKFYPLIIVGLLLTGCTALDGSGVHPNYKNTRFLPRSNSDADIRIAFSESNQVATIEKKATATVETNQLPQTNVVIDKDKYKDKNSGNHQNKSTSKQVEIWQRQLRQEFLNQQQQSQNSQNIVVSPFAPQASIKPIPKQNSPLFPKPLSKQNPIIIFSHQQGEEIPLSKLIVMNYLFLPQAEGDYLLALLDGKVKSKLKQKMGRLIVGELPVGQHQVTLKLYDKANRFRKQRFDLAFTVKPKTMIAGAKTVESVLESPRKVSKVLALPDKKTKAPSSRKAKQNQQILAKLPQLKQSTVSNLPKWNAVDLPKQRLKSDVVATSNVRQIPTPSQATKVIQIPAKVEAVPTVVNNTKQTSTKTVVKATPLETTTDSPRIKFVSHQSGDIISAKKLVLLKYEFKPQHSGEHLQLFVDDQLKQMLRQSKGQFIPGQLSVGKHQIRLELHDKDYQFLGVSKTIELIVQK